LLSTVVAIAAVWAAPTLKPFVPVPAIVVALIIGIALNSIRKLPLARPGIQFCIKRLLRIAVALLGIRIALSEIVQLGASTAILVVTTMALTVAAGILFARMLNQSDGYGALIGAGTAVCGASATLATSAVLPNYPNREADVAFVVVAVNALSTVAMLTYPLFASLMHWNATDTGIFLGATIHDVAQVVGAGYSVSETTGNTAVVVKLFRVLLLVPVVVIIGLWFNRRETGTKTISTTFPLFAVAFLTLSLVNSLMPLAPSLQRYYEPGRALLIDFSNIGLMLAMAALGLSTSLKGILSLGWRHILNAVLTAFVIFATVVVGTVLIQLSGS
jgi:uncharacterized integral membrane protein (TIGR00698 family)